MALRPATSFVIALLVLAAICPLLAQQGSSGASARSSTATRILAKAEPDVRWDARRRVTGDFDCDGQVDEAFLGRRERRVYVGVARGGVQKADILNFGIDERSFPGICGEPAKLA